MARENPHKLGESMQTPKRNVQMPLLHRESAVASTVLSTTPTHLSLQIQAYQKQKPKLLLNETFHSRHSSKGFESFSLMECEVLQSKLST